jgi:hypothetical protein
MSITLDNIPPSVEKALVARAAAEQKSVQSVALDALSRHLGVEPPTAEPKRKRDLSFLWADGPLEPEVLQALEDQRQIDPEMWQ